MHTLEELEPADFRYRSDGQPVPRAEVLPSITPGDRLGIVMARGTDGLGAGTFLLSCVIDFYESLREQHEEFFEYPDFYTVQATAESADYRMFDVYPDHKNVATEPTAEAVLRAVNDRAIDVLLVPHRTPRSPEIQDVTRRSAERGIDACFLYSPNGELDGHSFVIETPSAPVEAWFETTAESTGDPNDENWRSTRSDAQRIVQEFRPVSLAQALHYLPGE